MIKLLLNIPWYISNGYIGKLFKYIKSNGFKGLTYRIKKALKSNVYDVPAFAFANTEAFELLRGKFPVFKTCEPVPVHTESADIIICVHNAYDDVKVCIESVYKHTTEPFNIIIVDDGSGEQTRSYLSLLSEDRKNIKLFRNETAKGYTYAANTGLKKSVAEYCVLLNSDTIVTSSWLDKMINCRKSGTKTGIVGPLSNTASWQSIPSVSDENGDWASNKLPQGINLDYYAELIEKGSGRIYPKLPLLNGFCMMIHRSVINEIGYFDEENFGSGFCEEDDYNLRAGKAGFESALADDTYVYHAQSKSYSDEKRIALCDDNGKKLQKKHGDEIIDSNVQVLKHNFILEGIRSRARIVFERDQLTEKAKKNWQGKKILFLLPVGDAGGGGNVIIQEALSMIKMGINVRLYNLNRLKKGFESSYPNLGIPVIYGDQLSSFRKPADEFDIICASMYKTMEQCNFHNLKNNSKIAYYIQDFEPYFIEENDKEYKAALNSYTSMPNAVLVTKTEWNRSIVEQKTGAKPVIIGKSADIDLFRPRKLFPNRDKPVIAAMIRPYSPRRSPKMTLDILNEISKKYSDKVSIFIFGSNPEESHIDRDFWNQNYKEEKIINLGILSKYEIASLLSYTDIFTDFSSFQAMGLTAMEAMACGCCVIVPKNGGSTEFVVNGHNGVVVDTEDKSACIQALCRLINNYDYLYKLSLQAVKDSCSYYPENCAYNFLKACFG